MTFILTYDLDPQSSASYGYDLRACKIQGQRSVGSEVRVETNGWTDGGDCIIYHANAVGNQKIVRHQLSPILFTGSHF